MLNILLDSSYVFQQQFDCGFSILYFIWYYEIW